MSNLLDNLRKETNTMHMALHVHPVLRLCQKKRMDRAGYIRLLKAFYSPWKLIVPSISSFPIEALRSKLLLRADAIQDDLLSMNVDLTLHSAATKNVLNEEEMLGIAYVIIGSSMGAAMLSDSIVAALGNVPISYLSMSPKKAGWPELSLELRSLSTEKFPQTAHAAKKTFDLIHKELSTPTKSL